MKIIQPYQIALIAFTCCVSLSSFGQTAEIKSIQSKNLLCDNDLLKIYFPEGYLSTDTFSYMEGFIQTFKYPDGSSISILCGANATFSNDEDQAKGLYSRKIKVKGYEMTFQRVTLKMKPVFDRAFDMIESEN